MKYHMKRVCVILLSFFLLFILVAFSRNIEKKNRAETFEFQLEKRKLQTWEDAGVYYLFLPSYADISEVVLDDSSFSFEILEENISITPDEKLNGLSVGDVFQCVNLDNNEPFKFCIMQSKNLPAVFLSTQSGTLTDLLADETYEEKGRIEVICEDGTIDSNLTVKGIHGRGNYAWENYEKKPFTLKLKESASILGLCEGKEYVLLSNASDPTLLRNELVRELEKEMNVAYSTSGQFIDLYMNGEYYGNYYLCEKIEIGEDRLSISNLETQMDYIYKKQKMSAYEDFTEDNLKGKKLPYNPVNITGGYLFEREFADRYKLEYADNPSSLITESGEHFIVKSPKYCSKEEITYLGDIVQRAENAILSGHEANDYIDIDSFVKKYLTEEVSKNYDGGISSAFFYKDADDDKLYGGPGWDYDMTFGNYLDWMEYFSKDPDGITELSLHDHSSPWYRALLQKDDFYEKVVNCYVNTVSPFLQELSEKGVDGWKDYLEASAQMDYIRWQGEYGNHAIFIDREKSFNELKEFINQRKLFLDSAWIDGVQYHIVKFLVEGNTTKIVYIKDGEEIGELPVFSLGDQNTCGWRVENETKQIDESYQIREKTTLIAVLE